MPYERDPKRSPGRDIVAYDPGLALLLCEEISNGKTIIELTSERNSKFPSRATVYRWIINNPEMAKAYNAARELSAHSMEEEALGLAREIKLFPGSGTKVRAYEVAMGQMRWSASRRNPREFGDRGTMNIVVPVSITTPMDLGGGPAEGSLPGVYDLVPPGSGAGDDGGIVDAMLAPGVPGVPLIPEVPPKRKRDRSRKRSLSGRAMREAREKYAKEHSQ